MQLEIGENIVMETKPNLRLKELFDYLGCKSVKGDFNKETGRIRILKVQYEKN